MPNAARIEGAKYVLIAILGLSFGVTVISYAEDAILYRWHREQFADVVSWLKIHAPNAVKFKQAFYGAGIFQLEKLAVLTVDEFQYLSKGWWYFSDSPDLANNLKALRQQLALKFWLEEHQLREVFEQLTNAGFTSLAQLTHNIQYSQLLHLLNGDATKSQTLWKSIKTLRSWSSPDLLDHYPVEKSTSYFIKALCFLWKVARSLARTIVLLVIIAVILLSLAFLVLRHIFLILLEALGQGIAQALRSISRSHGQMVPRMGPRPPLTPSPTSQNEGPQAAVGIGQRIFNFFFGRRDRSRLQLPFSQNKTVFDFSWEDKDAVVGEMCSITVKFYSKFLRPVECKKIQNPTAVVLCVDDVIPSTLEESNQYSFTIKFTPTSISGHQISFYANGICVKTFSKTFLPAAVVPSKTIVKIPCSTVVLKPGMAADLPLTEYDKYGNLCTTNEESLMKYTVTVKQIKEYEREVSQGDGFIEMNEDFKKILIFEEIGCYRARITFGDQPIANSIITFIILNDKDWGKMSIALKPSSSSYFEAYLLSASDTTKRKKVYLYLTTKQLLIKEYYMKIIPIRRHTMRVRTTLKLTLLPGAESDTGYPLLTIEEPWNEPVLLACKNRNVFVAAFAQILLRKTGGVDTFENKRNYLYSELRKYYDGKSNFHYAIKVNRETVLKDSQHSLKNLSDRDWGKHFKIEFINEPGLDFGGVSREWFQILCDLLFKPENHLFHKSGKDDAQSLIHPNPFRPASCKRLELYEFAGKIVAKHLIECAFGRQQYVRARFSRAFLSQIIGLDVSWRTFESHDKELYRNKIDFILKNDPEDLELTFTEDVYDDDQAFVKTVDLVPGGSRIYVTNSNKLKYLQLCAEYRMVDSVKDEIGSFTKGFNSLIPDNLLSIFDETELEFLICGTHEIDPTDLKENYSKCLGGGHKFDNILVWFWEIIFGFNQEELARLLQFTTGSAQLPPGGFKNLDPKFQISSYDCFDALPSAHTCFNMLCLPNYSSKEEFKRMLLIAINEGSEGFGLT